MHILHTHHCPCIRKDFVICIPNNNAKQLSFTSPLQKNNHQVQLCFYNFQSNLVSHLQNRHKTCWNVLPIRHVMHLKFYNRTYICSQYLVVIWPLLCIMIHNITFNKFHFLFLYSSTLPYTEIYTKLLDHC